MPSESQVQSDATPGPLAAARPLLLSTEAARRLLSCGKTTLFALLRDREIDSVLLGARRMIVSSSVEQFVARLRQSAL